jgi:hypothetical protein
MGRSFLVYHSLGLVSTLTKQTKQINSKKFIRSYKKFKIWGFFPWSTMILSYEKWNDSDCSIAIIMMIFNTSLSCFHPPQKNHLTILMDWLFDDKTDPRVTKCWAFHLLKKTESVLPMINNTLVVLAQILFIYLFKNAKIFKYIFFSMTPKKKFVKENWGIL